MNLPPFQTLIDAHGRDVYRFCASIVGPTDADDCYQETWLSAMRAYPRLTGDSNLRAWVLTIAHRKALDRLRARRRQPVPTEALPEPAQPSDAADPAQLLPGSLGRDQPLWQAVRGLPPKQRTALAMRFALDADYAGISAAMGTSEDAARRNVHEGLKRLRKEYRDDR